jgi:hypothetical protein
MPIAHTLVSLAYLNRDMDVNCCVGSANCVHSCSACLLVSGLGRFHVRNAWCIARYRVNTPNGGRYRKSVHLDPIEPWSASSNMRVPTIGDVSLSRYRGVRVVRTLDLAIFRRVASRVKPRKEGLAVGCFSSDDVSGDCKTPGPVFKSYIGSQLFFRGFARIVT